MLTGLTGLSERLGPKIVTAPSVLIRPSSSDTRAAWHRIMDQLPALPDNRARWIIRVKDCDFDEGPGRPGCRPPEEGACAVSLKRAMAGLNLPGHEQAPDHRHIWREYQIWWEGPADDPDAPLKRPQYPDLVQAARATGFRFAEGAFFINI